MDKYYKDINKLVHELLIPARTEKKINIEVFEKFYSILVELENEIKGKEYIHRKIAGLLYFISSSLSAEATSCNYDDELFIAAAKVEDMVGRILWDSPLKD